MAKVKEATHDDMVTLVKPEPSQAVAVTTQPVLMGDGKKYAVAKQVTFLHLQHEAGQIKHLKLLDAIYTGRAIKEVKTKKPARMAHVLDLSDGISKTYIVNAVLESELVRGYPPTIDGKPADPSQLDDNGYPTDEYLTARHLLAWSYVGKAFSFRKSEETKQGKGGEYYTWEILELSEVSSDGEVAS